MDETKITARALLRGRSWAGMGAGLTLALVLAACGSSADEGSNADPAQSAAESTSAAESESEPSESESMDSESESMDSESMTSEPEEEASAAAMITIKDFAFEAPDTIAPGTEITVINEDNVGHTVTSDDEGVFDIPVGPGEEVTFTVPDEAGEYAFHCTPHPNMTSTLVIG